MDYKLAETVFEKYTRFKLSMSGIFLTDCGLFIRLIHLL